MGAYISKRKYTYKIDNTKWAFTPNCTLLAALNSSDVIASSQTCNDDNSIFVVRVQFSLRIV